MQYRFLEIYIHVNCQCDPKLFTGVQQSNQNAVTEVIQQDKCPSEGRIICK